MTRFFKVSGSGNDFLALAEPAEDPGPERIRAWCRRGVSLGADGLFVLRRHRADSDGGEAVAMDYFNSDGLPANLCLNGTRCAAQLAFHLGWAEGAVRVETAAGPVAARRLDAARVILDLPPTAAAPREVTVEVEGVPYTGFHLVVGVPHFVLPWPEESLEGVPVEALGRPLRFHPAFGPAGANVSFVRFPARQRMEIRTYERGVEAETLSCGSGVIAAAAAGLGLGESDLPLAVATRGGFVLEVDREVAREPAGGRWSLSGDARVVAHGDLLPGAALAPS